MPKSFLDDEEVYYEKISRRISKRHQKSAGQLQGFAPPMIPPVIIPSFELPEPPIFNQDVKQLKRDLIQLERQFGKFMSPSYVEDKSIEQDWENGVNFYHDKAAIEKIRERTSSIFREDNLRFLNRIASIKAARVLEEEEKRKAIEKQMKEAKHVKEKATEASKPVVKPPSPPPPPAEVVIGGYDQDPSLYEHPATSNRAKGVLQNAQAILTSVDEINNSTDPTIKKHRMEIRMTINRRVGQVSNSAEQVLAVIKELMELANNEWKKGAKFLHYASYIMAVKFIEQAETQISLHAPSAFPYGQVAADLIGTIPAFKDILMAMLIKRCPYIVPRYPPKLPNQSDIQYKIDLGYKHGEQGITEDESSYTERMSGLVTFYAALVQSVPLRPMNDNPYDVKYAWIWLVAFLQMPPRPITPYVLASFFDIAGYRLLSFYQEDFLKMLHYCAQTFIPQIPSVSIGARTRLKIFVESALQERAVDKPEGLEVHGVDYKLVMAQRQKYLEHIKKQQSKHTK